MQILTWYTNEFGPINAKLRQCDVDDLLSSTNWGFNNADMPNGYDETTCKEYLIQAEAAVRHEMRKLDNSEVLSKLWSLTNKIEVLGDSIHKQYFCYKEKMFKDNGWCYTDPWWRKPPGKDRNWGFCGQSCKLMQNQATMPSLSITKWYTNILRNSQPTALIFFIATQTQTGLQSHITYVWHPFFHKLQY